LPNNKSKQRDGNTGAQVFGNKYEPLRKPQLMANTREHPLLHLKWD